MKSKIRIGFWIWEAVKGNKSPWFGKRVAKYVHASILMMRSGQDRKISRGNLMWLALAGVHPASSQPRKEVDCKIRWQARSFSIQEYQDLLLVEQLS